MGMKKLVALYKTYRGGEWFEASLESIRQHCEAAVVVSSEKPWKTVPGDNHEAENCVAPLERFRKKYPEFPVTLICPNVRTDTEQQYRIGLNLVSQVYGADRGVLIVDTDEVWDDAGLARLKEVMSENQQALYFRSRIHTYLRSPLYRVFPQESARPVVALANPSVGTGKSRFADLPSMARPDQIVDIEHAMHHFGYVRLDIGEIMTKLATSSGQDGTGFRKEWMAEVWDDLPEGRNIHPTTYHEHAWPGAEEVGIGALPDAAVQSQTFWMTLAHHRGGVPGYTIEGDDAWREREERNMDGTPTTTSGGLALCMSAALTSINGGRTGQDDAIFLTPRLRMSFRETVQLAEHARSVPENGVVLEIGSGLGGSLAVIGSCAPVRTRLFAVDPFVPYDEENVAISRDLEVGTPAEFRTTMATLRLHPFLFRSSSTYAREIWGRLEIDLLLVDGNHSYANAREDMGLWWHLVKPGGTMLLHDLSGRFPGVVRAAREFEESTGLKFSLPKCSTLAWVKKPKETA